MTDTTELTDRQKNLLREGFIRDGLTANMVCKRERYDSPEEHEEKAAADPDIVQLVSLGLLIQQSELSAMEYYHPPYHKLTGTGKRITAAIFPDIESERTAYRPPRPKLFAWLWS